MSPPVGRKVTSDPEAKEHPVEEPAGIVLSDSLAAESLKSGGSFAANESKKGISGQPSRGTTANNTDASNAKVFSPAPYVEARPAREDNSDEVLNEGISLGKYAGRGPTYNIPDRDQSNSKSNIQSSNQARFGNNSGSNQNQVSGGSSKAGKGPTYVEEGGFDDNAPNASFNSDVGDQNDPARLAERQYQKRNMQSASDAGAGPRHGHLQFGGQYAGLREEQV